MSKIDELLQTLKELESLETEALANVEAIKKQIKVQEFLILMERFGVTKGSKIEYQGKFYVINDIKSSVLYNDNKPWLTGFLVKKDGSVSEFTTNLFYKWTVVSEEQSNAKM